MSVPYHYSDVIMATMASQITSPTVVYSTVYSDADQRKHQSSVSLAFVRGIHRSPVNSPHKVPVTQKIFPFDDVIMYLRMWDIHLLTDAVVSQDTGPSAGTVLTTKLYMHSSKFLQFFYWLVDVNWKRRFRRIARCVALNADESLLLGKLPLPTTIL